jgi:hypothetical protein
MLFAIYLFVRKKGNLYEFSMNFYDFSVIRCISQFCCIFVTKIFRFDFSRLFDKKILYNFPGFLIGKNSEIL